ncbi:GNAT family N-acetyltransferase [Salinicoccus halitifaciens]|uniref:GCN5-related N-acetyltransferase n=1 Tax=Salinicoccus halitifaciens TaxID=1073415 RepID=A0ABV2ECF3_9STAP|nr:GNAT family N-acetyltransferase [Salinicoccus halitifaciens]MCD2138734.1 GNAT family N-acetyltransferase [Salinicoccus halitifaciens]
MEIKTADTKDLYDYCLDIRMKVFVEEQDVPADIEVDEHEDICTHFVLFDDSGEPVGTVRYRPLEDGMIKIERMAVLKPHRGKGYGYDLMEGVHRHAKSAGYKSAKLGAQVHAIPFYEKLGYSVASDEFDDAGIPHKYMIREL